MGTDGNAVARPHSPDSSRNEPTLEDVRAAQGNLGSVVRRTPLLPLELEGREELELYVKPESFQRIGSFKIRGAMNFLANLPEEIRSRGVVAQSSGNHAQGVAAAARHFGVRATIVIPEGAPTLKVENTRALGAEVVRCANTQEDREGTAIRLAEESGATLVPPYDHPWIVAGQATVGLEIVEDLPRVANVIAPIGGGGLASGVGLAVGELRPEARVLGAEPELAGDALESFAANEVRSWSAERVNRTLADGARTQSIGELNLRLMRRWLAGIVPVEEARLRSGVSTYARRAKLVVEPTGALSLGALMRLLEDRAGAGGLELLPGPTVLVISGGNIDPELLAEMVTS